ncbi:DsbA family oxidoreductase [Paenibacillus peoriae]|uniref:DsbA family oxidoreductase n=1 Tax=Paenibacillus peoriae TaxID=59893 RepID=UPI00026C6140|nr:DsbA family oxidoreductase [Paenibacillus peoriae]MEC0184738.1 DsbA family oxidoreductase [Paenibacillus peoriae]
MNSSSQKETTQLTIDVWADVLCPWCYVGEKRLELVIEQLPFADDINLRLHTFQLDPTATSKVAPTLDYLSRKYGVSVTEARSMEEGMAQQAAHEGLKYEVDRPQSSTFDMLRLVHLGSVYGVAWKYLRAMQTEVFSGNFDAFEHSTLIRIGEGLGIPTEEIRDVLTSNRYADAVLADHNEAVKLGATGVPFTVIAHRVGIPGAVSTNQYRENIEEVWGKLND